MKSWCNARRAGNGALLTITWLAFAPAGHAEYSLPGPVEAWVDEPMPPGFQVFPSELEGPVFADSQGRTLYEWPLHKQRNGYSGESPGTPACYDDVLTVTAGLMSPYPAGILLPDLDNRPSCTDLWPPVLATIDARPVGRWSIVGRRDGSRQWAYRDQPLYTSSLDREPGDVFGGQNNDAGGDDPAYRVPIGPAPRVPPGFSVRSTRKGRLLTTDKNESVYAFDGDSATATACRDECTQKWRPLPAPALAHGGGDWTMLERSPGFHQWVFRGQPLYDYLLDQESWSQQGNDEPGWRNVYTQLAPSLPESFTVQPTIAGDVLADSRGMTIYVYNCGDDSQDQLSCDHPDDTQVYRLAMCGGGDWRVCLDNWPYVRAAEGAIGSSRTWRVVTIDPQTGHFADPKAPGALRVWAYRDRPVYTYAGDRNPGDVNGGGIGEWRGQRNGLRAFWLRDDFMRGGL